LCHFTIIIVVVVYRHYHHQIEARQKLQNGKFTFRTGQAIDDDITITQYRAGIILLEFSHRPSVRIQGI
jgi:hypothetical protein